MAASAIIAWNGGALLLSAARDLMDRMPTGLLVERIAAAAVGVEWVRAIEKLAIRKLWLEYFVDLHVQADPALTPRDAHVLSGKIKGAIRAATPGV